MHDLFVREVLKRQRDSIQGLNAQSHIAGLLRTGAAKNAAKSGEAPSPDTPDPNKFNILNG